MDTFKAARLQAVRKDALSGLMQGSGGEQEYRSSIAKLMAAGDIQGANAVTSYYKAAHPELNPYQTLMTGLAQDRLQKDAAQATINKYPQDRRNFWSENPDQAPADYKQAQDLLTGQISGSSSSGPTLAPTPTVTAPQPVVAPGATTATPTETASAPKPEHDYNRWKLIQSGKMLPPESARAAMDSVDSTLDVTRGQIEDLLKDPNLPKVFGGIRNITEPQATPGNPLDVESYPGSYNVLPSWITAGTPAAGTATALEAVKNQASTVVLNALKESGGKLGGSTGLGRVLQSEFAAWQHFFGSLQSATTVDEAKKTLNNIIKFIDDTKKRHAATYKSDYGDTGIYPDQAPAPDLTQPTASPQLNAPPVPGATQPIATHQTPEATRNFLDNAPEGITGTLKFSDGTSVKAVRKNGHWYAVDTGKLLQ